MGQAQQLVGRIGFEHLLFLLDAQIQNRTEKISEPHRLDRPSIATRTSGGMPGSNASACCTID